MEGSAMFKNLTGVAAALAIVSAGCSDEAPSSEAMGWTLNDDVSVGQADAGGAPKGVDSAGDSVVIEACAEDFEPGPLWKALADKRGAIRESRWIVSVASAPLWGPRDAYFPPFPVSRQFEELLARRGITHWVDERYGHLMLDGPPAGILSLIQESCEIRSFDLTGFHCDCAPQQCARARDCRMTKGTVDARTEGDISSFHPIIGCKDDVSVGLEYVVDHQMGPRGVTWSFGTLGSGVLSWEGSACMVGSQ